MLLAAIAHWRYMKVIIKYFQNPGLLFLMRIGLIKLAYFPYQIRKGGHNYRLLGRPVASSGGDFSVLREVLIEEIYRGILELLPEEPIRAVDIGSNIGAFTIWLHAHHNIKEAFSFEPDADCFRLCQFNISQNGCGKVSLYQQAVGTTVRETAMWVVPNRPAQSSLYQRVNATVRPHKIQVVGFNEWLEGVPGTFDLLKIDCEGAEWEILDATPAAFTRFSVVVAEVHTDPMAAMGLAISPLFWPNIVSLLCAGMHTLMGFMWEDAAKVSISIRVSALVFVSRSGTPGG